MHILFLSTWFPYPPDNGAKLRVHYLVRALGHAHTVTLVSFSFGTAHPMLLRDIDTYCADVHAVQLDPFAANQAGILRTFLSFKPVVSRRLPTMQRLVSDVLRVDSFDAVIASTEMMAAYALQTPGNVIKVLEEHNSMARWMYERYAAQTRLRQRLRCWASWQKTRYYEARLFGRFDLVTMVSEQDRSASQSLPGYRGRVEVIPNGVDCTRNHPGLRQARPHTLVYNGALTYDANYDAMHWFLAEVYPVVKAHIPDVSLTITGSTDGVDLGDLALDESVHLSGLVDDVRLPVAAAQICIAPIRQGGGTRIKILEAMALGTPVVATTKGVEGLELVNGEHVHVADTPEALARLVVKLLGDPAECARLTRNARRLVERLYDWEPIGGQFVDLVEETVSRREAVG